jgi:hypothetical protein
MSVVAIIPVRGRLSLLVWTLDRLKAVNKVDHVVLVGQDPEAKDIADVMGFDWIYHPNFPLGLKYNEGWEYAYKKYDPDFYLFMGTSDWMSADWIPTMVSRIGENGMIGRTEKYYYNISPLGNRLLHHKGSELGMCSILSRAFVSEMDGRPFNDVMDTDLDWSLRANVKDVGMGLMPLDNVDCNCMSVSYHKWVNMYNFEGYWNNKLLSTRMSDGKDWLRQHFRDALEMTLW